MKFSCTLVLFLCLLILTGFSQEQQIQVDTGTGVLKGTLTLPPGKTPVTVVLLIAGSGPTDRNGNSPYVQPGTLKLLSTALAKNGIASLRFDKRGVAASAEAMTSESDLRFETYIDDVRRWIDFLANDPRFSAILVAGHSEGALIGLIASVNNKNVAGYISLAGVGFPADVVLRSQLREQPDVVKDVAFPILDSLKAGRTVQQVPPMLNSLFRPSVQPYLISWFRYDPQKEIAKLTIPVLIIQGTTDIQVSVSDAQALEIAASNDRLVIIENMNHILKHCETMNRVVNIATYSDPDLPLKEGLMNELTQFINLIK